MTRPFRWNVKRRSELGTLADGPAPEPYPGFIEELRDCAAKVVAMSRESDLVFVGRSPENLFDYLSGVLGDTGWHDRVDLLNISLRGFHAGALLAERETNVAAARQHMTELAMDPGALLARERPVALVDLVAKGLTFGSLADFVTTWSREQRFDVGAMRRKLRFLGITQQKKTSPNTWRWHQHASWLQDFPGDAVLNVSVPWHFWDLLGNTQKKTVLSNPPRRWGEDKLQVPPHYAGNIEALRLAARLYDHGCDPAERARFAAALAGHPNMRSGWLRTLVLELRWKSRAD